MRSLVIGYGNPNRSDDGAGWHVVNALRERWAQPALDSESDGADELGGQRDTLILQQLTPELTELLSQYDRVVWIDAAVGQTVGVLVQQFAPSYQTALVSHHMAPPTLLALTKQLYGRAPEGWAILIAAHDMSFSDHLSPGTAALVPAAVARAVELLENGPGPQKETGRAGCTPRSD